MNLLMVALRQLLAAITLFFSKKLTTPTQQPIQITNVVDTSKIERLLSTLPEQITTSITNTTNGHKGKLGELIGYINLKAQYDRLIPLGNISDYIGIRFQKGDIPGSVDFIDIKTGPNARLSKDQAAFKKLLLAKAVDFKTIKIHEIEGLDVAEENPTETD